MQIIFCSTKVMAIHVEETNKLQNRFKEFRVCCGRAKSIGQLFLFRRFSMIYFLYFLEPKGRDERSQHEKSANLPD